MPRIVPIRDLTNTVSISELCHAVDEPIFVTKNGQEDMVVMSMEYYASNMRKLELYVKIAEAEEDIREGRIISAEDSLRELRAKYEL